MKQIVDKLNKIAKAIDSNVKMPKRKLIIDSLDAITTALKGKIINSHLIVDKLQRIALACEEWDGGGGDSEECCFDYKEVKINIDDRVSPTDNDGEMRFFIDYWVVGCVVPEGERHINPLPEVVYEWTGEEIYDNEFPTVRCVRYKDFRPLQQPYYNFKFYKVEKSSWVLVSATGTNCSVNIDGDGHIDVRIPENQEGEIEVTLIIERGYL